MAKKNSRSEESSRQSGSNFTGQECEGWLQMKRVFHLRTSYVKTWCSFKNKILSVFQHKNGKHLEDINIEICRITPLMKSGASSFYFEIRHEWQTFHFGTKDENEYTKWIKLLQNESLKDQIGEDVLKRNSLFKSYSREESISEFEKTNSIDRPTDFNLRKSLENEEVYADLNLPKVGNVYQNSPRASIHSDDVFEHAKRDENIDERIDESNEAYASLVMDKFKLMADLERQIRDKTLLVSQINEILKMSHFTDQVDLFVDEHYDQLMNLVK